MFPCNCKIAKDVPIYKMAGNKNDSNNYCPISILYLEK